MWFLKRGTVSLTQLRPELHGWEVTIPPYFLCPSTVAWNHFSGWIFELIVKETEDEWCSALLPIVPDLCFLLVSSTPLLRSMLPTTSSERLQKKGRNLLPCYHIYSEKTAVIINFSGDFKVAPFQGCLSLKRYYSKTALFIHMFTPNNCQQQQNSE